jgi:class 3 adenylate cyclase
MDNLEHIRIYYSKFINSISEVVKSYGGKVIKNIGDCLLVYFPKSSNNKNEDAFREAIECGFRILDNRFSVNQELSKQYLPPFNYRISMDYGVLDLALVGDYSQIDLFGSTVNICSKINSSSSLAPQNEIVFFLFILYVRYLEISVILYSPLFIKSYLFTILEKDFRIL